MIFAGDQDGNWVGDLKGKRVGKGLAVGPSVLCAQVQVCQFLGDSIHFGPRRQLPSPPH
ncbi:hypothetical protein I79_017607 [Cricetulus griseus]|uniref:Uncharacterized protein n=1 Tax=Cricetulus griseus TaxID=10029 RepID=G3I2G6_CRIGR|nr:hypothetical protein I79_017607 [Cricetulus griseus]